MKTSRNALLRPIAAAQLLIAFSAATTLAASGDAPLVAFSVGSHWEGDEGGSVTIRNRGEAAMRSWTVESGGGPQFGSTTARSADTSSATTAPRAMLTGSRVMERALGGLWSWESSGDRREPPFDAVLESLESRDGRKHAVR